MGSYFGHTMTCADLNGDGYDDLVISAPYFSELNEVSYLLSSFVITTCLKLFWYFVWKS